MITLSHLQSTIAQVAEKVKAQYPDWYFGYGGLIPYENNFKYNSSPLNTLTFAGTGGDGVHYGILPIDESIQPVIMTVPMNFGYTPEAYNWILGENLDEFLALGYYSGWFFLEQLCYQKERILNYYSTNNFEVDDQSGEIHFITRLREVLGYQHQPLRIERIEELHKKYFHLLTFRTDFLEQVQRNSL